MSRHVLTAFGGLVFGATFWIVCGFAAAEIFSRMPGGAREGGGAMAGLFMVGPLFGFLGLLLGGWTVWRLLANPERTGAVGMGLAGLLAVMIIGTVVALQPTRVEPDDFDGKKAEFQVEVSFPAATIDSLGKRDQLHFQMRSADGTEEAPALRDRVRREGDRAIVPGSFAIKSFPRSKLLAVMKNDHQLMCYTLTVDGNPQATTEWSEWQPMQEGMPARWRLVVPAK
jgi:MFS family permease